VTVHLDKQIKIVYGANFSGAKELEGCFGDHEDDFYEAFSTRAIEEIRIAATNLFPGARLEVDVFDREHGDVHEISTDGFLEEDIPDVIQQILNRIESIDWDGLTHWAHIDCILAHTSA